MKIAPAGLGGRPSNAWTGQRRRQLVRLYTLTTLSNEEIQRVLNGSDFHPGLRDIQKTLRSLFPRDYTKCYREYRPSNDSDMYRRIDHIRRCKKGRISKHAHNGRKSKSMQRKIAYARRSRISGQWTWPDSFEGPADAFRGYYTSDEQVPVVVDNSLMDSQPVISNLVMLDGSTLQSSHTSQNPSSKEALEDSAKSILEVNRRSGSLRSLERYLSSRRSPSYLKQVSSVMRYSSSNSWRSSLTSLSSVTGAAQPIRTSHSLTVQEAEIWDEIIDEGKLEISQGRQPTHLTASLRNRTCCVTRENPIGSSKACQSCGLTFDHRRALQISSLPGSVPGYDKSCDFYGNTMLHCLAASTPHPNKLWKMRAMISEGATIHAHNTSGESFLHLLCEHWPRSDEEINDYCEFFFELGIQGLSFSDKDHHGRTALHTLMHHIPPTYEDTYSVKPIMKLLVFSKHCPFMKDNSGNSAWEYFLSRLSTKKRALMKSYLALETRPLCVHNNGDFRPHDLDRIGKDVVSPWVELLCQRRNVLNDADNYGDTALAFILKRAEHISHLEENVQRLLKAGANIEMRDRNGDTALIIAARRGLREIVIMLLEAGANVHTRSYDGSGVLARAEMAIANAQSEGNDGLYAKIMSCFPPLLRANAKHNPSEQDEFMLLAAKRSSKSGFGESGFDQLSIRI